MLVEMLERTTLQEQKQEILSHPSCLKAIAVEVVMVEVVR